LIVAPFHIWNLHCTVLLRKVRTYVAH
jgi:hypothetical protein